MGRLLWLSVLAVAVPMAARANTADVVDLHGTAKLKGKDSLRVKSTSTGLGCVFTSNLGTTVNFNTGTLSAISLLGKTSSESAQSGYTGLTIAPEPGTLALLGSGLLGMALLVRRKLRG